MNNVCDIDRLDVNNDHECEIITSISIVDELYDMAKC